MAKGPSGLVRFIHPHRVFKSGIPVRPENENRSCLSCAEYTVRREAEKGSTCPAFFPKVFSPTTDKEIESAELIKSQ